MSVGETLEFFSLLYHDVPPDLYAPLWERQDKTSTWLQISDGPEAFAQAAGDLAAQERDVYVSVSVAAQAQGPHRRISSGQSAGIMGLWADIDIADPNAHRKFNLPSTVEGAMEIIEDCKLEPTIVVHSGHGLQAWWILEDFWHFPSSAEHDAAKLLSEEWNQTLKFIAARKNQTLDSTFDLARVMRVPGTFNLKNPEAIVPVTPISMNGPLYTIKTIQAHVSVDAEGVKASTSYVVGDLTFDSAAQPPAEKFSAAMANLGDFESSWNRTRNDMLDQSGSSYDLSLATLAGGMGWTDQEIMDLLVAARVKHGDNLKRLDYYRRTIAKARQDRSIDVELAVAGASAIMDEAAESGDVEEIRDAKRQALAIISDLLSVEVTQAVKYTSVPPSYRVVTPAGSLLLTSGAELSTQQTFRNRMMEVTDVMIRRFKVPEWDSLVQTILDAIDIVEVGEDMTELGSVKAWLQDFFVEWAPGDDKLDSLRSGNSWIEGGHQVYFSAVTFKRWLGQSHGERTSKNELARMLRVFGCEPTTESYKTVKGASTSRALWVVKASDVGL